MENREHQGQVFDGKREVGRRVQSEFPFEHKIPIVLRFMRSTHRRVSSIWYSVGRDKREASTQDNNQVLVPVQQRQ